MTDKLKQDHYKVKVKDQEFSVFTRKRGADQYKK